MIIIKIAEEFTDCPGGATKSKNLPFSGEEFREELLYPRYIESMNTKEKLLVDLDGGFGYFDSFLKEAFEGLIRNLKRDGYNPRKALKIIKIKSEDQRGLVDKIYGFMKDEIKRK